MNYILDSNVFDYILDNGIEVINLPLSNNIYITNVQISEIYNTPDAVRRKQLEAIITEVNPEKLLLESGGWIDDLKWDDEQPWIDTVSKDCENLLGNAKTPPWKDALIGEVVKSKGFTLVTNDKKFYNRVIKSGINVLNAYEFFNQNS
ncbi:type II toxin-antitoxin system VapC family toxin [Nitrincola alkalisediminis]|uniref:type II toxin-antitoxin system VapC family toxin n=1 Tax=Nitrincola alkalisediminis TaxID=1366656 RepID=UPI001875FCCF|nr:PIN domain-containing protein [Nitrincola alkalisediminis]